MKKLFITILGIMFVNALFTLLPSINASIGKGILIVYQFFYNALFILSFLLKKRITFPQPENETMTDIREVVDTGKKVLNNGVAKFTGTSLETTTPPPTTTTPPLLETNMLDPDTPTKEN